MTLISRYESYIYNDYFKTELPKHWSEKCLGYLADHGRAAFVDGPFGSDLKSSDYIDNGVPLIQLNNIRDSKHLMQNMKFITEEKKQQLIRHLVIPNDIVIAKMAEPVARCAIVIDEYAEYVIVADCVKLTPNLEMVDRSYLVWAINSENVKINAELVSTGTTRIRINLGELKKLKVPYPPMSEQIKIAHFLDHKTAKIDTLIDKQQQLIQLLKEKRQAVISHAVTKGLNPNAPMRDSGVEWLGEVPEHWEILQLRRLTKLQQGLQIPQEDRFAEKGSDRVEYITIKSINAGLEAEHKEYIQSPSKRVVCLEDDVLLARTGATGQVITGVVGAFHNNFFKINYDQNKILKEYLVYFLRVTEVKDHLLMLAGTTTIPDLNHGAFLGTLICLPSIEEQRDICRYLDKAIEDYDYNIELAQRLIGLLHERRTALISAAVTGKIDVRHHASHPTGNDTSEVSA